MRYFFLLLIPFALFGQESTNEPPAMTNVLVSFKGSNQPYAGVSFYPASMTMVPFQTNIAGFTNMLLSDYQAHVASIQTGAAWVAGKANANASVAILRSNNLARLQVLYDLIPAGRTVFAASSNTLQLIEASLVTGTNTLPQATIRIRQLNGEVEKLRRTMGDILEYLQRLGPELRKLHRPNTDTTQ